MADVRCSLLVLAAGMPSSAARAVLAQEQRTLAKANNATPIWQKICTSNNIRGHVHCDSQGRFNMSAEPR